MTRLLAGRELVWWLCGVSLVAGCSTDEPSPGSTSSLHTFPLTQLAPGVILIASSRSNADISVDAPNDRLESAGEGAEWAARKVMNTPDLGNGQLESVVGVFGFAAAPFAAAYGAISAKHQRLSASGLSAAERDLEELLRVNAASDYLRQQVAAFAHQQTERLLVCAGAPGTTGQPQTPASGTLEITVEHLRLKAVASAQYVLQIQARAQLRTEPGEVVVLDRHYHYQSGAAMFVDWTRQGGLEGVAQTGYRILGEQIAKDIFEPLTEPPLRLGPGRNDSDATSKPSVLFAVRQGRFASSAAMGAEWSGARFVPLAFRLQQSGAVSAGRGPRYLANAGRWASPNSCDLQFVSLEPREVTSIEVHAGGRGQPSDLLTPEAKSADTLPSAGSETEWRLDGLENDRNAVVQGLSCLAAVPLGLWDQTIGAVRRHSREKTAQVLKTLDAIPKQDQFENKLADEVARCLRAQTGDEVRRTDEPLAVGLPAAQASSGGHTTPGIAANSKTALEIRVVNAQLERKRSHGPSRSLCVQIQATLVRTSDGQELYRRPIVYRSTARKLKDWARSDGRLLRQELNACSKLAAQALTDELVHRQLLTTPDDRSAGHGQQPSVIQ